MRATLVIAVALAATALAGCTTPSPSLIPIDISAQAPAPQQVFVVVEQKDQPLQSAAFDWTQASPEGVLRVAILLGPEISGEVLLKVHGGTGARMTGVHEHRIEVTPGQVAPTVRIALIPPSP